MVKQVTLKPVENGIKYFKNVWLNLQESKGGACHWIRKLRQNQCTGPLSWRWSCPWGICHLWVSTMRMGTESETEVLRGRNPPARISCFLQRVILLVKPSTPCPTGMLVSAWALGREKSVWRILTIQGCLRLYFVLPILPREESNIKSSLQPALPQSSGQWQMQVPWAMHSLSWVRGPPTKFCLVTRQDSYETGLLFVRLSQQSRQPAGMEHEVEAASCSERLKMQKKEWKHKGSKNLTGT